MKRLFLKTLLPLALTLICTSCSNNQVEPQAATQENLNKDNAQAKPSWYAAVNEEYDFAGADAESGIDHNSDLANAIAKFNDSEKKLFDAIMHDFANVPANPEAIDEEAKDIMVDNCSRLPEHCEVSVHALLLMSLIDFHIMADIFGMNFYDESDEDHTEQFVTAIMASAVLSHRKYFAEFQKDPNKFPWVTNTLNTLQKWLPVTVDLAFGVFSIYAFQGQFNDLSLDFGTLVAKDKDDPAEAQRIKQYLSERFVERAKDEYGPIHEFLDSNGLTLTSVHGNIDVQGNVTQQILDDVDSLPFTFQ